MSNNYDPIDEALNTTSDIVESKPIPKPEVVKSKDVDIEKDYEYSRANLYSLIEKGQEAINGIMEVAGEGGSPSCLLYTSPSPRDLSTSRMPSSA